MKIPKFVGQSYISRNPQFDCSRTVNLYPSVDEQQSGSNQQIAQLLDTPGLTDVLNADLDGKAVRGGYTSTQNQSFFVVDNTLYVLQGSVAPYTAAPVGNLLTSRGRVRFADNGNQMVLVDGPYGYVVNLQGQTMTQINDSAFYGSNFVEYYDGYFLFCKPNTTLFYWSDPNATTFDALNFANKSGNADPIAGLVVYLRQLWLIGTQTSEIWYDVGGDTTFQRLAGPYIEQGCGAPDSIAKSESGVFWLAISTRGGVTVVVTVGNSIQKVSTLSVDFKLQQYGQAIFRATGFCYQQDGNLFYQVNPLNGSSSWIYDYTVSQLFGLSTWHERTYMITPEEGTVAVPNGTEIRHLADCSWYYNGQNLAGSFRAPKVYAFDTNNSTDDGALRQRTRVAPHMASEGNRVFFSMFRLLAQVGIGSPYDTITFDTVTTPCECNCGSTSNVVVTGEFPPGGCTSIGFSDGHADGDMNHSPYGSIAPANVELNGLSYQIGQMGQLLSFFTGDVLKVCLTLYAADFVTPPPQDVLGELVYTGPLGDVHNLASADAVYQTRAADVFPAQGIWSWNAVSNFSPLSGGANVTFTFGTSSATTKQVPVFVDPPFVNLSWSDDGGYVFSEEVPQSMGRVGQYTQAVEWWRLGEGRNRAFRVRFSGPFPFNIIDGVVGATATQA
jgi:hypothetical protein